MDWIDYGYRLLWETVALAPKESPNKASAFLRKEPSSLMLLRRCWPGGGSHPPFQEASALQW